MVQPNRASTFSTPTLGTDLVILDEQGDPSETGEVFLVPPVVGFSHKLLNRDHDPIYYDGTPPGPDGKVLRRHGDQLEKLPDGSVLAIGRADDTMNLGGIKVGAAEIERVVADLPQVKEVAAIAYSPPEGGPSHLILCVGIGLAAQIDANALQSEMQKAIKTRLNPLFKVDDKGNAALVVALAEGRTIRDAAKISRLGERTVARRMESPEFRKLVADHRSSMMQRAVGTLANTADEAIATLRDLLTDDSATARLGAARSVLDLGARLRDSVELEARISTLEARLPDGPTL